jgi:hypothetical protein
MNKARRNYTQLWEQISSYRKKEGAAALGNFKLNILGGFVAQDKFAVPGMRKGTRRSFDNCRQNRILNIIALG